MNNILITINDINNIDYYKSIGINSYAFPLSGYVVGFNNSFILEDIPSDSYIIINRILDTKSIDELKRLDISRMKGILFDDLGVLNIFKDSNLDLIYLNSHFGTNAISVNYWIDKGISSVLLSNEITKEEIINIVNNTNNNSMVQIFGYNMIMYSRRKLLTNYNNYYKLDCIINLNIINNNLDFIVEENDYGTVLFNNKIYNGTVLFNEVLGKVKFFYINTNNIDDVIIKELLESLKNNKEYISSLCDNGFLNKGTIFKVGEV